MRAAERLVVGSARSRSGGGVIASLALHGGAAGLALAGLFAAARRPERASRTPLR
jgi:hypothetical protein